MKTRIMILACLLAVPAGRMAAQQQTDPEQKATVQTQGDSIIIRKGKGDMRIKVYEEQLEDGEKKEVQIYEGVYLEKVDADKRTFLDALPFIPKKRRYNAFEPHCSGHGIFSVARLREFCKISHWFFHRCDILQLF